MDDWTEYILSLKQHVEKDKLTAEQDRLRYEFQQRRISLCAEVVGAQMSAMTAGILVRGMMEIDNES